jgi:hypothetical protein
LPLPAGKYFILAKIVLGPPGSGTPLNRSVECRLVAGGDFDVARATTDTTIAWSTMTLNVVHQFAASSKATLECGFTTNGTNTKLMRYAKVTAVRGGFLSNTSA